ncbi:MAG: leucine-rich repeat domain-containing protein [Oscillospiraceae bacterium]|nr:leucine-rich repeat domain-containing protein [Oscillospiraceae bacterium]
MFKRLKNNKQFAIAVTAVLAVLIIFGVFQLAEIINGKTEAVKQKERGDKYLETYDIDNALRHYKWALEADPAYEDVYISLYEVYTGQGERILARDILYEGAEITESELLWALYENADCLLDLPEQIVYLVLWEIEQARWEIEENNDNNEHAGEKDIFNKYTEDGEIWRSDVKHIKNLSLVNADVSDYNFLKYFESLESIIISNFRNTDMSCLSQMKNLKKLELHWQAGLSYLPFAEFTILPELTGLETIFFFGEPTDESGEIADYLSVLSGFKNLTSLNITSVGIAVSESPLDLTPLSSLTQLKELSLNTSLLGDLTPLGNLTELEILTINSQRDTDLSPLGNLKKLKSLSFGVFGLSDISVIKNFTELEAFYLYTDSQFDISPLGSFTKLKTLHIKNFGNNEIYDLTPLKNLTELEELSLGSQSITDISPLENLVKLEYLELDSNPIKNLTPLATLQRLKHISLRYCDLTGVDLSALSDLPLLEYLDLSSSHITDISGLSKLNEQTELHLSFNKIEDFSPVAHVKDVRGR